MNERHTVIQVAGVYYLLTAWEAEEDYVTCTDLEVLADSDFAKENEEEYQEWLDSDPIAPSFDSTEKALSWGKRLRF